MLYHPFVYAYVVRERASRFEREAAIARLLSAPRRHGPGPEADPRPSGPAVTAAAGAGPPP